MLRKSATGRLFDQRHAPVFSVNVDEGGGLADMIGQATPTFTRASTALAVNAAGVLTQYAANVPRIVPGPGGGTGLLIEPTLANKCTNYNAVPNGALANLTKSGDAAATLTEVADSAALIAAGLSGICTGNVFKLDNTSGVGQANVIVGGTATNTQVHAVSCYIRGGTGRLDVHVGTGPSVTFGASASYVRRSAVAAVSDVNAALRVYADAGQVLYFILNQFEQYVAPTSPIVVAGATASRALETLTYPLSGGVRPVTMLADYQMTDLGASQTRCLAQLDNNSLTDRHSIYINTSNLFTGFTMRASAIQVDVQVAASSSTSRRRGAYAMDTNSAISCCNGVLASATDTSCSLPAALTHLRIGQNPGGSALLCGYIYRVSVYPSRLTDAQLQALTTL